MRAILWSDEAQRHYRDAILWLAERNPAAAARLRSQINATLSGLADMPTGRRGRVAGTYEKLVPRFPYILAYALAPTPAGAEQLVVLALIHTSRGWPEDVWPSP